MSLVSTNSALHIETLPQIHPTPTNHSFSSHRQLQREEEETDGIEVTWGEIPKWHFQYILIFSLFPLLIIPLSPFTSRGSTTNQSILEI